MGGGQPLESPGSCLPDFRHHPYLECTSNGHCSFYSEKMTYWLVAFDKMARNPGGSSATIRKRTDAVGVIARCRVCSLRPR